MNKLFAALLFLTFAGLNVFLFLSQKENKYENKYESEYASEHEREGKESPYSAGDEENPHERLYHQFRMLRDPVTNKIPDNIFKLEQDFAARLPKLRGDNPAALTWNERGPNNVGGRTRALLGHATDTNIVIAGAVSGGIWRSVNSGVNWSKVVTNTQLHNATCITQDRRTGQTNTWYMGTGERDGNTAGQFGAPDAFTGDGVFKSVDNGLTWNLLASTSGNPPSSFNSDWQYVWNISSDASNATDAEVYAATIGGVYRTTNGGTTWAQVLGSSTNRSLFTDVQCGNTGVTYAGGSFTTGSPINGIHRSVNGTTWANITPSDFPATYGRIVIGISPSNENIVYFGVHGVPDGEPNSVNKHQLWKYQYVSGDGTGAGGIWTPLGSNLPQAGQGNFGNFNEPFDTQDGYDFMIQVSPADPNFIILGGVNIYRSPDGFTTTTNTRRIGGYQPNTENGTYPSSHPDIHTGYFQPGSSTVYYNGHDGGISRTDDITATVAADLPVTWRSLSGSYNVTQFYAVSMDPQSGSPWILGGFQDNGSYATNTDVLLTPWSMVNSGDGAFCEIAPLADNRIYSSSQNGNTTRVARDGQDDTEMKPAGSTRPMFINPFTLDENNSSLFYFGGGNSATTTGIWRNTDAVNATTTNGWSYLSGTDFGAPSARVSTIGISKGGTANVVYYGSDEGHIRRIDNANTTANVSANLNGGGMPAGYVSCLAVDPLNSSKVIAVFSNYNVQRLWYSTDAGATWTNIDGNLAGANGPSTRWATIFYVDNVLHVFLATSVGVYYTTELNGASTTWTQEATTSIGNVVTVMFDYRSSDNTLVAATHGRGSFSTRILTPLPVELIAFNASVTNSNIFLSWTTNSELNNSGFEIQRKKENSDWANIGFINGAGTSNNQHSYSFNDNNLQSGRYKYRLKQIDFNGNFEYHYLANEVSIGLPNSFVLSQNYPNPFNPVTKINFALPSTLNVTLKIYDVSGKEVARLINNEIRNAGNYSVDFDGSKLSSGVYFYRLEAGSFTGIKKMMLVK